MKTTDQITEEARKAARGFHNWYWDFARYQTELRCEDELTERIKAAIEKAIKEHDKEQHYYAAQGEAEFGTARASEQDTKRLESIKAIEQERVRQIEVEGWSLEHDATHNCGELVQAALCYITRNQIKWPWLDSKPKFSRHTIRNLTIAGALIAAEIDRLQPKDVH